MAEVKGGETPNEQPQLSSSVASEATEERAEKGAEARTKTTEERAEKGAEARTKTTEERAEKGAEARTETTEERAEKGAEARTKTTEERAEKGAEATEKRAEKGAEARTETTEERAEKGAEARTETTKERAEKGAEATEKRAEKGAEARTETTKERAEKGAEATEKRAEKGAEARTETTESNFQLGPICVELPPEQFKLRRFFVLRPGTLNQAIKDVERLVDKEIDGSIHSIWLMAEVDHWNNEKERIVLITKSSLLVFKYDFVMFNCDQFHRIPLNFVDRISYGTFSFPKSSFLQREGEGVRVFWDRLREPSFTSRWNPFATDMPSITFTYHPVRNVNDTLAALCDIQKFREHLWDAAQKVHIMKPVPGKANGVLVLNQQLHIEAYVGFMSFLGNQNKLGYCMARGNIGY